MNKSHFLHGWNIVILRPLHQAPPLQHFVSLQGGKTITLPMITLHPLPLCIPLAWQADMMIVTSPNAITFAPPLLFQKIAEQSSLKIITMGKATSLALTEKHIPVFFTAPVGSTSESLLTEPFLQASAVDGKSIALLAGEGGRTLLADELQKRRARIQRLIVYRQERATTDLLPLLPQWQQGGRFCFIVTSLHCFENLLPLASPDAYPWFKSQTWIVVSARIQRALIEWGATKIITAQGADFHSLTAALAML